MAITNIPEEYQERRYRDRAELNEQQARHAQLANSYANASTGWGNSMMNNSLLGGVQNVYKNPDPIDPNKDPALSITLQTLVDLWCAAFGTGWVLDSSFVQEDPTFWVRGRARLARANLLEQHEEYYRIRLEK